MEVELSKNQKLRLMEMVRLILMSKSYESIELDGGCRVTVGLGNGSKILFRPKTHFDSVDMCVITPDLKTKFRVGKDPAFFAFSKRQRLFNKIKEEIDRIHRAEGESIISKVTDKVDAVPALGIEKELERLKTETASG